MLQAQHNKEECLGQQSIITAFLNSGIKQVFCPNVAPRICSGKQKANFTNYR